MVSDEYRAVFEAAPDGILVVDHRGIIRSANPMAGRMFGFDSAELVGKNVDVLVPDAARAGHVEHRSRYVRAPRARPMGAELELSGRRKDGTEFPAEISLSPWESAEGMRIIVIIRDLTQRKRLRDFGAGALRASEDERRRIARELHDDTAQHLASLLMWVRLIEPKVEAEEVREKLRELRNEIASCAEGVRRIARGLRPPELEDAGLVAALRAHARSMRDGAGMDVRIDAEGAVDSVLGSDARLVLYRIVQESVSNALRHAGTNTVRIELRVEDGKVVGHIRDEGKGFAEENRAGAGLGLIGMQERAAMVGGRLSIESQRGKGTLVRVELPVEPERS
ncbi:MAG: PAS domain-containing sensor histidine kinase [Gemmatimonadales bacterium]